MFFLIQAVLGSIGPQLLHVNLQIRPYNSTDWYVGLSSAGNVALLRGRNLDLNARIHGATGSQTETKRRYRIFVDGERICHIKGVVRACKANTKGDLWEITPVFPEKRGGNKYLIRNGNPRSDICITQRRWDMEALVMEKCNLESKMQHWEIGFRNRWKEGEGTDFNGTYLGDLDRKSSNIRDVPKILGNFL